MPPESRSRTTRRSLGLVLILLSSLVLLELTLQAGALAVWLWHRPAPDVPAGNTTDTILCVGDSFTWGVGASSRGGSYPERLASRLRERTQRDWRVVRAGWPGRDSRQVLALLPAQIREHRPRCVCVLVGANDMWSLPAAAAAVADASRGEPDGFRLELRTLRLIKLLAGATRTREANTSITAGTGSFAPAGERRAIPAELQGWWRFGDQSVRIAETGALEINGAAIALDLDGERIGFDLAGSRVAGRWRRTGDVLVLSIGATDVPLQRMAAPASPPALDVAAVSRAAWEALGRGDPIEAETQFRRLIGSLPDPLSRRGLVQALSAQGREDDARRETDALGADWARAQDVAIGVAYLEALEACCRIDDAFAAAQALIRVDSGCATAWRVKGEWHRRQEQHEEAAAALERAIALQPETSGPWRATLLRQLAVAIAPRDPRRAVTAIAQAHVSDHDRARTAMNYRNIAQLVQGVPVEPILAATVAHEADRSVLREVFADQDQSKTQYLEVVTDHLRQIGDVCRRHQVELVLLGYPLPLGELEAAQRAGAELARATFVPVWPRFARELEKRKREELFVADGHCNDAGYDILAEIAVAALLPRLRD